MDRKQKRRLNRIKRRFQRADRKVKKSINRTSVLILAMEAMNKEIREINAQTGGQHETEGL